MECDHGFLPDVEEIHDGRAYTASPPCPECKPELAEILSTALDPPAVLRIRARRGRRARREPLEYDRRGWSPVVAAAHAEVEQRRDPT